MKQHNAFPAIPAITARFMASNKNAWGISSNFTVPGTPARPEKNPHFWVRLQHIRWVREGHGEHLSEPPRDKTMPTFLLHGGGTRTADTSVSLGAVDHPLYSNNDLVFVGLALASYQILTRNDYSPVIQR